jgi:hypothetical protein
VVRWWPAGAVRGPSVPFCGRYDAIDDKPIDLRTVTKSQKEEVNLTQRNFHIIPVVINTSYCHHVR